MCNEYDLTAALWWWWFWLTDHNDCSSWWFFTVSSLPPICNPNFSLMGGVGGPKKKVRQLKLGCEKYFKTTFRLQPRLLWINYTFGDWAALIISGGFNILIRVLALEPTTNIYPRPIDFFWSAAAHDLQQLTTKNDMIRRIITIVEAAKSFLNTVVAEWHAAAILINTPASNPELQARKRKEKKRKKTRSLSSSGLPCNKAVLL